jgi:protein FAM32A
MPSDAPVIRGALKLKGSGITKKKKKKAKADAESSEDKKSAIQKALEEEDTAVGKEVVKSKSKGKGEDAEGEEEGDRELEERGHDGKTASERAYEEMRRKRVCVSPPAPFWWRGGRRLREQG